MNAPKCKCSYCKEKEQKEDCGCKKFALQIATLAIILFGLSMFLILTYNNLTK
jgi:hypothetical protein